MACSVGGTCISFFKFNHFKTTRHHCLKALTSICFNFHICLICCFFFYLLKNSNQKFSEMCIRALISKRCVFMGICLSTSCTDLYLFTLPEVNYFHSQFVNFSENENIHRPQSMTSL